MVHLTTSKGGYSDQDKVDRRLALLAQAPWVYLARVWLYLH
jgi:hypothetical protein